MSPTKSTDIDNPMDYSSTAPTEILSNNENSSCVGGLEPNETQEEDNNNNNNDDDNGKNSNLSQSDKEQPGQLK